MIALVCGGRGFRKPTLVEGLTPTSMSRGKSEGLPKVLPVTDKSINDFHEGKNNTSRTSLGWVLVSLLLGTTLGYQAPFCHGQS